MHNYENTTDQGSLVSSKTIHETNQLIIVDIYYTEDEEYFSDMLGPLLIILPITRLKITASTIFIGTLINLVRYLPNLDSLEISSLRMLSPRCLSIDEAATLRLLSNHNKITTINLRRLSELAEIQFLFDLCSSMRYFEVDFTDDMLIEAVIRYIFITNTKRKYNQCVFCLKMPQKNKNIVHKLRHMIKFEQLCNKYKIQQLDDKVYLEFDG